MTPHTRSTPKIPLSLGIIAILISSSLTQAYAAPTQTGKAAQGKKANTHPKKQRSLSMRSAVQAALKKHPMSSIGAVQREVGEAYHLQASSRFAGDPSYNITYRSDQLDSSQGFREFEGSLDFPIWNKGQKAARHQLGNRIIDKSKTELTLLKWTVAGEVLERAWAVRMAQMEVNQARKQQQSAKRLEADVNRRVQAGEIARADLLLTQQSSAQADLAYQRAMAQVELTRAAWQAYTGYTQLPADLMKQSRPKKSAHNQHPHVIASKARMAEALARRQDIRKQRKANPTLSLYAKRDRGMQVDPFNNSLGVGVSMPFGRKSSSAPSLAEANAMVAELQAQEAIRERQHELEIRQATLAVKSTKKALSLAHSQSNLAQKRWKLSKRAFDLGESDLFLLIRAREEADKQVRAIKRSQLELSLSQARLNHVLGATPL